MIWNEPAPFTEYGSFLMPSFNAYVLLNRGHHYKKSLFTSVNRSVPDVKQKRKEWSDCISGYKNSELVFLDESGCNTDLTRRYARSVGGSRAVDSVPLNTPTNTTILSTIQLDGKARYTTFCGRPTTARFLDYLEQVLLPHLDRRAVLVMDALNLLRIVTAWTGRICPPPRSRNG